MTSPLYDDGNGKTGGDGLQDDRLLREVELLRGVQHQCPEHALSPQLTPPRARVEVEGEVDKDCARGSTAGNLSLDDKSNRMAQCWVCNWSRQTSLSGLWASPPPWTTSTNANKPVRKASSDPVLRRSVALVVQT